MFSPHLEMTSTKHWPDSRQPQQDFHQPQSLPGKDKLDIRHTTMDHGRAAHKSPDRTSRSSFSSIRETDSDLTQTFTTSKISAYLAPEEAIGNSPPTTPRPEAQPTMMVETQFRPPLTHPQSKLHGYWVPADNFKGWKQINVKGKLASKSFGDLQVLNSVWSTEARAPKRQRGCYPVGESPFEKLPVELLTSIINLLVLDVPPNGITRRNVDLMSLLCTSRTIHSATLGSLYHKITIPHSRIFQKFLSHISQNPVLGTIVRRLDFCHFNPSQLFSTAAERSLARNLTSETLLKCLELTPYLHEFLAQEYIDDDLDATVLQKLFLGLPRLQAVDFCGCSSASFKAAFSSIVTSDWPMELSITRLSLHKCLTLPSAIFEAIMPRLSKLTHLDVAGTRITDAALASIPETATITHLNLAKCNLLTPKNVINFLANHPAAQKKLTLLSLASDARSHQLLDVEDLRELLPILPDTLRSLSLKGSKMDPSIIELLRPLTKHLEELALGRSLELTDVNRLFVPDEDHEMNGVLEWVPHTLTYLDLSDMWGGDLDLSYLFGSNCAIMTRFSEPLTVVEITEDASRRLSKSPTILPRAGWKMSECGSRTWLVRERQTTGPGRDDGRRSWKMGVENWGMRKVPVADAEVGGMYGSYMFARKL